MRRSFILIMLLLSVSLGGCWDIRYLDELSTTVALGIDLSGNDELQVTVQVVNPTEVSTASKGGGGASPVTTYSATGKTVFEAIRQISNETSRRLFFSHNQVLVIGEELARKGVGDVFEFIERDPEVRTDFYVVVAKGGKAADVLKVTTPIEKIPGTKIHDNIENVENKSGTSFAVRVEDVIETIGSDKKEITMGSIEVIGNVEKGGDVKNVQKIDPQTIIKLDGMAVFKGEKLIQFFNAKKSRGISWVENKIKSTVVSVPCKNERRTVIEIIHSSTKLKAKFQQGKPYIDIKIMQEANIAEILCPGMKGADKAVFDQLAKETGQEVTKEVTDTVTRAQKLNTDIFGFADAIYKSNPSYWKKNRHNWDYIYPKIPIHVEVITQIRREGIRNKSYFEKIHRE